MLTRLALFAPVTGAELELVQINGRESRLRRALRIPDLPWDLVLIDCAGRLDKVQRASLAVGLAAMLMAVTVGVFIGAVAGMALGEVVTTRGGQDAFLGVYREALDTAHAYGIHAERIVIDHERFYLPPSADEVKRAEFRAAVAGLVYVLVVYPQTEGPGEHLGAFDGAQIWRHHH